MPDIFPFRAIHYPWGSDFRTLTAPPYDVISPEEREALIGSHDNNVIRVTLGGDHSGTDDGKYKAAGMRFRDWLASGILVRDEEPQFFLYGMTYRVGDGRRTTIGLLASLALAEFGAGDIHPHERTIPGPIKDRLELMRTTQANLEPLWFFASSKIQGFRPVMDAAISQAPLASVTDSAGVEHALWPLSVADASTLVRSTTQTPLVIADGHHRYETALAYRRERKQADGEGPWDQTLALIVDPVDYPPLLQPIHRVAHGISVGQIAELASQALEAGDGMNPLENLSSLSDGEEGPAADVASGAGLPAFAGQSIKAASVPLEKVKGSVMEVLSMVEKAGQGTVGVVTTGGAWLLRTRAELDTIFLNDHILEPSGADVRYEHDPEQVEKMLAGGAVAFVLAPAPIESVAAKALAGERMPPKTTLFWPKPRTGFVMRDLSGEDRGLSRA